MLFKNLFEELPDSGCVSRGGDELGSGGSNEVF